MKYIGDEIYKLLKSETMWGQYGRLFIDHGRTGVDIYVLENRRRIKNLDTSVCSVLVGSLLFTPEDNSSRKLVWYKNGKWVEDFKKVVLLATKKKIARLKRERKERERHSAKIQAQEDKKLYILTSYR